MGERLSMLDTMFLELEQHDASAHMHIGAGLIFEPLPGGGTPDLDTIRAHVRARLAGLPRYEQRLSSPHAGPLTWLTWEPATLDLAAHVHHATLPAPGDDAQLREWLADFWSHRLDRHVPLWEMTLLDGLEGGRWALASKTHHCLVDGVGSWDIGYALLDLTPEVAADPPAPPSATPAPAREGGGRGGVFALSPGLLLHGTRAGLGAALHPREAFERVRAAVDLIVREDVIAAPATSLNGEMSGLRLFEVVRFGLDDLKAVKRERGGTVNDVVLALCAGGLRHLLLARGETPPASGLRAQIPVNIRAGDREHALGNELTSLFIELPVAEPDPVVRYDTVLERAEAFKASRQGTGGKAILDVAQAVAPIAGDLAAQPMFGSSRAFNLTITNVPGPQFPLYALGAKLTEILPLVPLFAGHAVGIAAVSYDGQLVFGINADRLGAGDAAVLADGVRRSYDEIAVGRDTPAGAGRR